MNLKRVHRHGLVLPTKGETSGLVNVTIEVWVPPFIRKVLVIITTVQRANLECRW